MPTTNDKPKTRLHPTIEVDGYVDGLYKEFHSQAHRYMELTRHFMEVEARVELAEKNLCLTRDHLAAAIARIDNATPRDWKKTFASVRFVGYRLADACVKLLRERKKLTSQQLLEALNNGMYRFRTNTPLREIHAALLRQQYAKRQGDTWIWRGPKKQETRLQVILGALARHNAEAKCEGEKENVKE